MGLSANFPNSEPNFVRQVGPAPAAPWPAPWSRCASRSKELIWNKTAIRRRRADQNTGPEIPDVVNHVLQTRIVFLLL